MLIDSLMTSGADSPKEKAWEIKLCGLKSVWCFLGVFLFLALVPAQSAEKLEQSSYKTIRNIAGSSVEFTTTLIRKKTNLFLGTNRESLQNIPEQTYPAEKWIYLTGFSFPDTMHQHHSSAMVQSAENGIVDLHWLSAHNGSDDRQEKLYVLRAGGQYHLEFLSFLYGKGTTSLNYPHFYTEEILPFVARRMVPGDPDASFHVLGTLNEGQFVKRFYYVKAEVLNQRIKVQDIETYLVRLTREDERVAEFWVSWEGNRRIVKMRNFQGTWFYLEP